MEITGLFELEQLELRALTEEFLNEVYRLNNPSINHIRIRRATSAKTYRMAKASARDSIANSKRKRAYFGLRKEKRTWLEMLLALDATRIHSSAVPTLAQPRTGSGAGSAHDGWDEALSVISELCIHALILDIFDVVAAYHLSDRKEERKRGGPGRQPSG